MIAYMFTKQVFFTFIFAISLIGLEGICHELEPVGKHGKLLKECVSAISEVRSLDESISKGKLEELDSGISNLTTAQIVTIEHEGYHIVFLGEGPSVLEFVPFHRLTVNNKSNTIRLQLPPPVYCYFTIADSKLYGAGWTKHMFYNDYTTNIQKNMFRINRQKRITSLLEDGYEKAPMYRFHYEINSNGSWELVNIVLNQLLLEPIDSEKNRWGQSEHQ